MTETPYFPSEGDVVTFPRAPLTFNRTQRYIVTACVCNRVFFMPEGRDEEFNHPIAGLWDIGMTKVPEAGDEESIPETPPRPEGNSSWPSADELAEMSMYDQEMWERRCAEAEAAETPAPDAERMAAPTRRADR